MALFKRRNQVSNDERAAAAARNQYQQRSSAAPRHERTGPAQTQTQTQQYAPAGRAPEQERSGTAYQGGGSPQGTGDTRGMGEPRGRAETRGMGETRRGLPGGWVMEAILGLATLVLGLIVAFHPVHTLTALAVLIGVLMIVSGVYHVVRSLRNAGDHRMWGAIAGVLFFLAGIFLIRHVALTLALIALFAGFAFIIAGIAALAEAISGRGRLGRPWSAFFGIICIFAGIAAITTPIGSLARLAIVLGWAFVAFGLLHMIGAFASRHDERELSRRGQVSIPGQRADEPRDSEGRYEDAPQTTAAGASSGGRRRHRL
jgi:uncharacterized membrane protein HdeD (DUF308 family)